MIFYHFTSVPLAESILHSGISEGHLSRSDGTILKPIVWLTTDSSVNGHGLPTGGTIPESKRRYAMAVQGDLKKNLLQDKTQVRLRVRQLRVAALKRMCSNSMDALSSVSPVFQQSRRPPLTTSGSSCRPPTSSIRQRRSASLRPTPFRRTSLSGEAAFIRH